MQAVIPAAGKGTRLRPLTETQPKALVDIAGKPLLSHLLDRLTETVLTEVIIVVGYRGEQIVNQYGERYDSLSLDYVRQEKQQGLAHAIAQAEPLVSDDFLVVNGDNVLGFSPQSVFRTQQQPSTDVTLLTETADKGTARTTGVVVTDEDRRVKRLVEKPDNPPSNQITTGVYGLSTRFFDAYQAVDPSERGEYELPDVINQLLATGATVEAVELDGWRVNVNEPADRKRAKRLLTR